VFKLEFADKVQTLREQIQILSSASSEMRNSSRFARLLEVILQLGNALNSGAASGGAKGFRLDSLLRVRIMLWEFCC